MVEEVAFTDIYVDEPIVDRVESVLRSTRYVKGPLLEEFEDRFADLCETEHAVGVSSGTAALLLAMKALDVGPGDEVFVPAHTYFASASPVLELGATPRFVEVNPATYTLDVDDFERAVEAAENPVAVVPVHLYGRPAAMEPILEIARIHDLAVVEDAAQAHAAEYRGRPVGGLGDVGCFSFYPSKNMTVGGDGGMLVTDDAEIARAARELRNHGRDEDGTHVRVGLNHRLDEINAAVGLEQVEHVERWGAERNAAAQRYAELLGDVEQITVPAEPEAGTHVYHLYVIRTPDRDALQSYLERQEIQTGIHYPTPVHRQPAVVDEIGVQSGLERTERLCEEILSLPMHPRITDAEIEYVCETIREFYEGDR
jgi:dTDP-4-amino-4,6-dideoxygalactose transaminase